MLILLFRSLNCNRGDLVWLSEDGQSSWCREWSRRFPPPPWRSRPRPAQVRRRWPRPWPQPPLPPSLPPGQLPRLTWPLTHQLLQQLSPLNNNNSLSLSHRPRLQLSWRALRSLLLSTAEKDGWAVATVETIIPVLVIRGWKIVAICHRVWTLSIRPQGKRR